MMLTQRLGVLAHDFAKQCHVSSSINRVEEKARETRSASITEFYHTNRMEETQQRKLLDFYELGDTIGNGGFGSVYAGISRLNGDSVAIKVIPKTKVYGWSKIGQQVVPKEIALLHCMQHKFIIKMLDYFEDVDHFYIVMERPEKYIDLFDYITQKGTVSERSSRYLFRQVVEAVQYCLSVGVVHRDVKDENILIDLKNNQIKLIDFGSGTFLRDGAYTEYEGTRVYCPPEWVLSHRYHAVPATVWSLGILLYDMLLGDVPFEKEAEIVAGHLPFQVNISQEAQSLIRWMLAFRPEDRPTIDQVLNHVWMKMGSPAKTTSTSTKTASSSIASPQITRTKSVASPYQTRAAVASSFTPPIQTRSKTSLSSQSARPISTATPVNTPRASPSTSRVSSGGVASIGTGKSKGMLESRLPRTPLINSRKGRLQVPRK